MKKQLFLLQIVFLLSFLIISCDDRKPVLDKNNLTSVVANTDETTEKILQDANATVPVGVAVKTNLLAEQGSDYRNLVIKHFNRLAAENDMKMRVLQPEEDSFDFSNYTIQNVAKQYGLKRIHGHTLIWYNSLPQWVLDAESNTPPAQRAARFDSIMSRHIRTVIQHYDDPNTQFVDENGAPLLKSWDVINEALYDDGTYRDAVNIVSGKDKGSIWCRTIGRNYIEKAYRYARKAARANGDYGLKLFYNDFGYNYSQAKLDSIYALVMYLKNQTEGGQVLLNGVGMQMHFNYNTDTTGIGKSLRKMASTGLLIYISELDIKINPNNETLTQLEIDARASQQKMLYEQIAQMYQEDVPQEQRFGITLWSLGDGDSGIGKVNGMQIDYPCLFDTAYNKKPSFFHFYDGLHNSL